VSRRPLGSGSTVATASVPDRHLLPGAGRYAARVVVTAGGHAPAGQRAVVTVHGDDRELDVVPGHTGRDLPGGPARLDFLGALRPRTTPSPTHERMLGKRPRRRRRATPRTVAI
jgi:hypothetical protein